MEDVSEYLKESFLGMYKNNIRKNYQQKTLKERLTNFENMRRETRNTIIFQKRQIDEDMCLINTPEPSTSNCGQTVHKNEAKKPNKRLEMLQKWKAEKEKRKQEEKKKAKPIFKVFHVPEVIGLPNLENVNTTIKGKSIKGKSINLNTLEHKSQFAPPNHKFHAPKSVKPIKFHFNSVAARKLNQNSPTPNVTADSVRQDKEPVHKANKETVVLRRTTRATTQKLTNKQKSDQNNLNNIDGNKPKHIKIMNEDCRCGSGDISDIKGGSENKSKVDPKVKKTSARDITVENNHQRTKSTSHTDLRSKSKKIRVDRTADKAEESNASNLYGVENQKTAKRNKDKIETKKLRQKNSSKKISNKESFRTVDSVENLIDAGHNEEIDTSVYQNLIVNRDSNQVQVNLNGKNAKPSKSTPRNCIKVLKKTRKFGLSDMEHQMEDINDSLVISKKYVECEMQDKSISENKSTKPKNNKSKSRSCTPNLSVEKNSSSVMVEQNKSEKRPRNSTGSATGSASPDYPIDTTDVFQTPVKNQIREDLPVYISPFVTLSRGKSSARKEYHSRRSADSELGADVLSYTSPKAGADYFARILQNEINRIEYLCETWDIYKNSNEIPEGATDMINVAIGQSKLLITKKFSQFQRLIDQCKTTKYEEKPITCEDLHGFWDMIYIQVEDVDKRFKNLDVLKENNWEEVVLEKKTVAKCGRGRPKKATASAALKNLIKARRNAKKATVEGEITLIDKNRVVTNENLDGKTPLKSQDGNVNKASARRSLRISVLTSQTKSRPSSSPGLTMMKISQAIKSGDGLTPSKSILKTDLTKSEKRIAKSVLFKDTVEDTDISNKENDLNEINLITFSPITPTRKSTRLSKIKGTLPL